MLTNSYATESPSHFYIGGGPGLGIQYFKPDFELFAIPHAAHPVLGGRLFIGYQFNQNWGIELGYTNIGTYYNYGDNNQFVCTSGDLEKCKANFYPLNRLFKENLNVTNSINASAIDLALTYTWPVSKTFSIFAKAGAAYIDVTTQSNVIVDLNFFPGTPKHVTIPFTQKTGANNHGDFWKQVNPVVGIGDIYQLTPHLALRFEYLYYFPVKLSGNTDANSGTLIPSIISGELVYAF